MTAQIESRQRKLETRTNLGLGALATAALAEAVRVLGIDSGWITGNETMNRVLLGIWIAGLLVFGIAFTSLWLLGQRLDETQKQALGDELQLFISRRSAATAFVATYLATVLVAAIPATVGLPGRVVGLGLMAVATGALLVSRLTVRL
ncbi:MAG: hypothetical protein PVG83_02580 [Acidimicrobiia bacterium]|jgi:hypothetical protein